MSSRTRRLALASSLLLAASVAPIEARADDTPPFVGRSFTVGGVGDVILQAPVRAVAQRNGRKVRRRYDFAPQFAPMHDAVADLDLAICHMEMPIGAPRQRPGRYRIKGFGIGRLYSPYEVAADLAAVGFDRCSTASNHSYDLGAAGIASNLAALDAAGISHAGTARSPLEATPALVDVEGVKVAHLSYTKADTKPLPPEGWQVAFGTTERIVADVTAARAAGAEVVILSLHWGAMGETTPRQVELDWMDELLAAVPVDLVIIHGPHVVQPVGTVRGTPVFWSVGNFVSGMGPGYPEARLLASPRALDGILATARFTEVAPGQFRVAVSPVGICTSRRTRTVYPASATLARTDISKGLRRELSLCLARLRRIEPTTV